MTPTDFPIPTRVRALLATALLLFATAASARSEYGVDYTVQFLPQSGQAQVTIKLTPGDVGARRLRLAMPEDRYTQVGGDGEVVRKGSTVTWTPLRDKPSKLRYRYRIDHQRRDGGYDARITADWAIVRGDDLVPSARVRASKGADSRARLRFVLPKGWTNVDTPFMRSRDGKSFVVVNPDRRFDRPIGWIIAGAVGTRREYLGARVHV